jgi:hypothetical protein
LRCDPTVPLAPAEHAQLDALVSAAAQPRETGYG